MLMQERGCKTEYKGAVIMEAQLTFSWSSTPTWPPLSMVQHPTRFPIWSGEQRTWQNASPSWGSIKLCLYYNVWINTAKRQTMKMFSSVVTKSYDDQLIAHLQLGYITGERVHPHCYFLITIKSLLNPCPPQTILTLMQDALKAIISLALVIVTKYYAIHNSFVYPVFV